MSGGQSVPAARPSYSPRMSPNHGPVSQNKASFNSQQHSGAAVSMQQRSISTRSTLGFSEDYQSCATEDPSLSLHFSGAASVASISEEDCLVDRPSQHSSIGSVHTLGAPPVAGGHASSGRRPPNRGASLPAIAARGAVASSVYTSRHHAGQAVYPVSAHTSSSSNGPAAPFAFTPSGPSASSMVWQGADDPNMNRRSSLGANPSGPGVIMPPSSRHTPTRFGQPKLPSFDIATNKQRFSFDVAASSAATSNRVSLNGAGPSTHSAQLPELSAASQQHGALQALHRAVEKLLMSDSDTFQKVASAMRGISSLSKETDKLEIGRDTTGATCINQYVVVKTLGAGSFGKVKLCLNTMDGQLYAVKMVNRTFILKLLQKPQKPLRRRAVGRISSETSVLHMQSPIAHRHHLNLAGLPKANGPTSTGSMGILASASAALNGGVAAAAGDPMARPVSPIEHTGAAAGAGTHQRTLSISSQASTSCGGTGFPLSGDGPTMTAPAEHSPTSTNQSHAGQGQAANPLDDVRREIAVLKKLDHPNIVHLYEVIDPPGASYMMLVMEYMERGPVMVTKGQSGFDRLPEDIAHQYFRQVCAGLDYLHFNHVVHGDLKPENLLVASDYTLKIGDFGSSRVISDPHASSKVSCTPAFQAPECILQGVTALGDKDGPSPFAADVWALGVCLYCFVFGRLPFRGSCVLDINNAILHEQVSFPVGVHISDALRELFTRIFLKDPAERITLQGIMEHPWTTDFGSAPMTILQRTCTGSSSGRPGLQGIIEVTPSEAKAAIAVPSLCAVIRAKMKEKVYGGGEYLFREGELANCIYMIMSGVVELVKVQTPDGTPVAPGTDDTGVSFTVDLDESFVVDCKDLVPEGTLTTVDGQLHIDRNRATELKKRMAALIMGTGREYVVQVKGPGQVVGEVSLESDRVALYKHSARAKGPVTAIKLTEENFMKALLQMFGGAEGDMPAMNHESASMMLLQSMEGAGMVVGNGGDDRYSHVTMGTLREDVSMHNHPRSAKAQVDVTDL